MVAKQSRGVDVFVRVGENEELHIATIRDVASTSQVLQSLALELMRLAGPVRLQERILKPNAATLGSDVLAGPAIGGDFYAEDLS